MAARLDGAKSPAEIGERTPITGLRSLRDYRADAIRCFKHCKAEMGLRDAEKFTGEHVREYLRSKIDQGVSLDTWKAYASGLAKFENVINSFAKETGRDGEYHFREAIDFLRAEARQELHATRETRAYENPRGLIDTLRNSSHQIAARVQLEGGARVYEAALIKEHQLKGIQKDKVTGRDVGVVTVQAKGGKMVDVKVSTKTYAELKEYIREHGKFRINQGTYRENLKQAAQATDQKYSGSHGLRHNFARERMEECQACGQLSAEAMSTVSREMGHGRADITREYLR